MREDVREMRNQVQSLIKEFLGDRRPLRVLEAGCGSTSRIQVGPHAYVVGIDISEKQLERNSVVREKILGDIQTYPLPERSFDLIVCWNVLEHLPRPELALRNMARSLSYQGLLVLAIPNVLSIKGLIAKLSPQWVHVWTYRYALGRKHAGTEDHGPFPTFLRFSIRPSAIKRFARKNGFSLQHLSMYEATAQMQLRQRNQLLRLCWSAFKPLVRVLSLGRIDPEFTECLFAFRKEFASGAPRIEGPPAATLGSHV